MKNYWDDGELYSQPSESLLRRNASDSLKKQKMKGKAMHPILISGRKIARSWWGNAWCENLEGYADYASRLERGKRYVRTGTVVDLQIEKGKIQARVQGRRKAPYKIEIRISPLDQMHCQQIMTRCTEKVENIEELLAGNFPLSMKELFTGEGGLSPKPSEISFNCSCPDWALMCKHVAAALYGVGARLDEDPSLFFELRGIDMDRFLTVALDNRVELMLENATRKSPRIIEDTAALSSLFGVLPNTSFSQNVGLVSVTKVVNRFTIMTGAIFLILCGFCPKLSALFAVMPQSVLGGAAVIMFASILVSGIQSLMRVEFNERNTLIIALAIGLGIGIGQVPTVLAQLPSWVGNIFAQNGIIMTFVIATVLNLILPGKKD